MRVHFCIHHRTAEVFSRSSTRSLRPVLGTSLPSLYCEVHVHLYSHHLLSLDFHHRADVAKFILQLGLQLESALPSLLALTWPLRFDINHRLLDFPSTLTLPRRSRFQSHSCFVTCRPLRFLRICIVELLDRKHVTVSTAGGFSSQCCFAPVPVNELHSFLEQLQIVAIIEQLDIIPNLITPPSSTLSLCRSSGSDDLIVLSPLNL